ncbi:hypothetical protein KBX06_16455 [Micromonospora sp. C31]|uniref:hypothetical protein n=1 Tax=Micromonospora sp. C31 TaxID=2824876 RepID=UPI001B35C2E9|nr:hypothetical protein [Micromonospora sp. C31]MBQ1074746.1 hypothetical protein [Micromonospora sp. C31]
MAPQKRNVDRYSSNVDAKTDVMVRDDVTAVSFLFPHSDFFRHTGTDAESELTGGRPAPRVVATDLPGHETVS